MSKPSLPVIRALLEAGADPDATWQTLHAPTSARLEAKGDVLALVEEFDRKRFESVTPEGAGVRTPIRL